LADGQRKPLAGH